MSCRPVDINRKAHVWGLLAAEAGKRGQPVSIAAACQAAVRILSVAGARVAAVAPGDVYVSLFATDALGMRLEELQTTLGEGPGLQAFADGAPVLTSDLAEDDRRWSLFGSGAVELGVRAVFAFPLCSGPIPIGVFEVYRSETGALTTGQLGDALVLSDVLSVLLLGPETESGTDYVHDAIASDHHAEVYQATGMVSVHLAVSLPDALARLRGHAFAQGQPISTVAREIVSGRLRLDRGETDD